MRYAVRVERPLEKLLRRMGTNTQESHDTRCPQLRKLYIFKNEHSAVKSRRYLKVRDFLVCQELHSHAGPAEKKHRMPLS